MPTTKKTEDNDSEDTPAKVRRENRGQFVKYMGSSDVRRLATGETLLMSVEPLTKRLEWNPGNNHILNTADYEDVPQEFWDKLTGFDDFKDVTAEMNDESKEVPKNQWEKIWSKEALQSDRLWAPPSPRA